MTRLVAAGHFRLEKSEMYGFRLSCNLSSLTDHGGPSGQGGLGAGIVIVDGRRAHKW